MQHWAFWQCGRAREHEKYAIETTHPIGDGGTDR